MADEKELQKLFGKFGDVDPTLEAMFGNAYLDHPDNSTNVPEEMDALAEGMGTKVYYVNELVKRAIEEAKEIDCHTAQRLLLQFLDAYTGITDGGYPSMAEEWQISRHLRNCGNDICYRLNEISIWDKYLDGEQMEQQYGKVLRTSEKGRGDKRSRGGETRTLGLCVPNAAL